MVAIQGSGAPVYHGCRGWLDRRLPLLRSLRISHHRNSPRQQAQASLLPSLLHPQSPCGYCQPSTWSFCLLLIVLPRTGWLEHRRVGWPFIGMSFVYLANLTPLFGVPEQYSVLWSLAVEEHFYLIWPAVVRRLSRRTIGWCALGIFLASPAIRALSFWLGRDTEAYTWVVADGLAIGALLGVLARGRLAQRAPMLSFSAICTAVALAIFAIGTPFGIWRGSTFCGAAFRLTAVNLFCTGILGASLLLGSSRLKWIVQRPLLQWFGGISYGHYLFHMLAFDFVDHWILRFFPGIYPQIPSRFALLAARFVISIALAVGVSFLSRRYFEERFLRLKQRWTTQTAGLPPGSATAASRGMEQRTA